MNTPTCRLLLVCTTLLALLFAGCGRAWNAPLTWCDEAEHWAGRIPDSSAAERAEAFLDIARHRLDIQAAGWRIRDLHPPQIESALEKAEASADLVPDRAARASLYLRIARLGPIARTKDMLDKAQGLLAAPVAGLDPEEAHRVDLARLQWSDVLADMGDLEAALAATRTITTPSLRMQALHGVAKDQIRPFLVPDDQDAVAARRARAARIVQELQAVPEDEECRRQEYKAYLLQALAEEQAAAGDLEAAKRTLAALPPDRQVEAFGRIASDAVRRSMDEAEDADKAGTSARMNETAGPAAVARNPQVQEIKRLRGLAEAALDLGWQALAKLPPDQARHALTDTLPGEGLLEAHLHLRGPDSLIQLLRDLPHSAADADFLPEIAVEVVQDASHRSGPGVDPRALGVRILELNAEFARRSKDQDRLRQAAVLLLRARQARQAGALAQELTDPAGKSRLLQQISRRQHRLGDPAAARQNATLALAAARAVPEPADRDPLLARLALAQMEVQEEALALQALEAVEGSQARLRLLLSLYEMQMRAGKPARHFIQRALDDIRRSAPRQWGDSWLAVLDSQRQAGDREGAVKTLAAALDAAEKTPDPDQKAWFLEQLLPHAAWAGDQAVIARLAPLVRDAAVKTDQPPYAQAKDLRTAGVLLGRSGRAKDAADAFQAARAALQKEGDPRMRDQGYERIALAELDVLGADAADATAARIADPALKQEIARLIQSVRAVRGNQPAPTPPDSPASRPADPPDDAPPDPEADLRAEQERLLAQIRSHLERGGLADALSALRKMTGGQEVRPTRFRVSPQADQAYYAIFRAGIDRLADALNAGDIPAALNAGNLLAEMSESQPGDAAAGLVARRVAPERFKPWIDRLDTHQRRVALCLRLAARLDDLARRPDQPTPPAGQPAQPEPPDDDGQPGGLFEETPWLDPLDDRGEVPRDQP